MKTIREGPAKKWLNEVKDPEGGWVGYIAYDTDTRLWMLKAKINEMVCVINKILAKLEIQIEKPSGAIPYDGSDYLDKR